MPSYVVAGASRGLGLEFLRQLSAKPENVVIGLVRNKDTAEDAVALEKSRSNLHLLQADITDIQALKDAAEETTKIVGSRLNYLINNAAFQEDKRNNFAIDSYPSEQALEDDIIASVKTNAAGVIHTINAFLPLLKTTAAESVVKVVTLSSGMADTDLVIKHGVTMSVPYAISKAALNMAIAKYAARFGKNSNLGFLAISPGVVNTSNVAPTPEQIKGFEVMAKSFKNAYPDWTGPITPEVSVEMTLDVINRWDIKDTGAFISHYGTKQWL